jgi:hypothetical protein
MLSATVEWLDLEKLFNSLFESIIGECKHEDEDYRTVLELMLLVLDCAYPKHG